MPTQCGVLADLLIGLAQEGRDSILKTIADSLVWAFQAALHDSGAVDRKGLSGALGQAMRASSRTLMQQAPGHVEIGAYLSLLASSHSDRTLFRALPPGDPCLGEPLRLFGLVPRMPWSFESIQDSMLAICDGFLVTCVVSEGDKHLRVSVGPGDEVGDWPPLALTLLGFLALTTKATDYTPNGADPTLWFGTP